MLASTCSYFCSVNFKSPIVDSYFNVFEALLEVIVTSTIIGVLALMFSPTTTKFDMLNDLTPVI